ncbi:hypothetical protein H1P_6620002 [Hyella patelloides LEGE 07179]|uniref:Uncharacterized protein n=1 Tax=Hyella patelloides LEGE 07179 TaxID=945734 RepID=A0A563W2P8_9CYAN|nr:hypothetical protein [Hyella patelloides]VEP17958.1 hypothetical protein H1P_6620002 [Hyella patelloides LEGE 07179]
MPSLLLPVRVTCSAYQIIYERLPENMWQNETEIMKQKSHS